MVPWAQGELEYALGQVAQVRVYFWRHGDDEVNLVYDHPEKPMAFEIAPSPRHHRGTLARFPQRFRRFSGQCYLVAPSAPTVLASRSEDGIGSLPLDLFLLAVGGKEQALARRLAVG
jgi:hypothetical protein